MTHSEKYLSLAIGTSMSQTGKVDIVFVKAFLMGHIIGKHNRDVTEKEMEFINSIENIKGIIISPKINIDEICELKNKELAARIKDINYQYTTGNITKKQYEIKQEHCLGFYHGLNDLYYTLIKNDITIRGVLTKSKYQLEDVTKLVLEEKKL
jgi:hypothetical protein